MSGLLLTNWMLSWVIRLIGVFVIYFVIRHLIDRQTNIWKGGLIILTVAIAVVVSIESLLGSIG